ncbi:TPA: hypothetical protein PRC53_001923 [Staphylococcus aureus]|nr:hypothetical protein [Staphylococcus aureus]
MIDSQLDGNVTAKELSESFKELVEEFERIEKANKNSNSKDKKRPFYTDKEKAVLFLYTFLTIY